ncbi:serine/threonine protein kinase [Arthrobacter sp. B2a2-09]|uniref:serine/threonine protein kinase n=1 Tax=Arthrobacter sp. B2a2-09 TaxID=2952822 RepID=UPI0022CDB1B9|nr:serine/threonine-protein kinase [Arthrobacter sp. B2a2-09]MCZ9881526.1 serine/threonine protein kinase [Arthrobacter sp. B2a2-09]
METFSPGEGGQGHDEAMPFQGIEPSEPVIPGFVPVRELGRGGSATVWLATERRSGNHFAVKCLGRKPERMEPGEAKSSMLREVRLLSRLDHEHLVKVRGVVELAGSFDGGLGVVMDYAPGGSLGQLVSSRGRLGVGETVTILTPLAQALAYLHRQGMTHSDVSPGNVLFTAQGKPLLSDMGVSRVVGDASGVPDSGTPGFVDPGPIVRGAAELQPQRDTYALAALGWYCLTGSAPDIAARRPPLTLLVPAVPTALAVAIEAGLHPDGQRRPSAAELGVAVYRSAAPEAVDLSVSVHATVVPELMTRRRASDPRSKRARIAALFSRLRPSGVGHRHRRAVAPVSARRRAASFVLALGIVVGAGSVTAVFWGGTVWWAGDRGPGAGPQASGPPSTTGQEERSANEPGMPVNTQQGTVLDEVPASVLAQIRSQNPGEAVRGLSAIRDTALRSGRFELLDHVNVQGSAAASSDGKVRDALTHAGLVLAGFSTSLISVSVEGTPGPDRATVAVTLATSAYAERDASGKVVRAQPQGEPQELRVVLLRGEDAWRITEILAKQA